MNKYFELDKATIKKLFKLLPNIKELKVSCRKIAFSQLFNHISARGVESTQECCKEHIGSSNELKRHISECHFQQVLFYAEQIETNFSKFLSKIEKDESSNFEEEQWKYSRLSDTNFECTCEKNFKIILYYHYINIKSADKEVSRQEALCETLNMKGKIRVATEGINGTVEGCECAVEGYINYMKERFPTMTRDDFKRSNGNGAAFDCLKVSQYEELCSMGISSEVLKTTDGGHHLTPEQFHQEVEEKRNDTILLDCRNFYESKIGYFEDAVKPDLRKFSYFPAYVDKNPQLFKDKRVLMYCTGGIRCERASAYIKKAGVCKEVLQLKGGIHKYLEKYPDGHYKGKLFVFDERYCIGGESQPPVARCKYCVKLYDQYKLCTTPSCRQLVLSCDACRSEGKTACCERCKENVKSPIKKEECECTRSRYQVPVEHSNAVTKSLENEKKTLLNIPIIEPTIANVASV